MRFFDRYGFDIQEGDIIQNLETGNLLRVLEVNEETVKYTTLSLFASVHSIPTSNDGYNFVRQPRNYESGEETIESEFVRTGWTIPNTPQEDALEARLQERQTHFRNG